MSHNIRVPMADHRPWGVEFRRNSRSGAYEEEWSWFPGTLNRPGFHSCFRVGGSMESSS